MISFALAESAVTPILDAISIRRNVRSQNSKAFRLPMRFDLIDLRLFLHVVEAGSITHGAERMHLAVAAASTRIRNMELALGTALLQRQRLGVQPTPAGRTLVHHARLMLQQAERMRGELGE